MRHENIIAMEEKVRNTGNGGEYTLTKIAVPVPGEDIKLEGFLCVPNGREGYYYKVEHPKQRIVLHFTAGNIRSDLGALTRNDYHVSVAFVIGRDGTIYQLFSSKYWSGHLGKGVGNEGTGNAEDKSSIGIELSNYGYLSEVSGNLETYYSRQKDKAGKPGPVDVYCSLADTHAYKKLETPFRNQRYYASHTPQQYNSLIVLLRYLTTQYKIPRNFLPDQLRYVTTPEVLKFKGIVSHINYRKDGKWDIGQAFEWEKVIKGVQAEKYIPVDAAPKLSSLRGLESVDEDPLTSEDALESLLPAAKDEKYENEDYEELQRSAEEVISQK
ncbi:MAG: N-acetylmuramoyl-L-alanine amidase [Chitinophagaceae bacterium]|nr:N-acetylmuramoyl-L-alanine amidase [Chitinophagaceae bacterium]